MRVKYLALFLSFGFPESGWDVERPNYNKYICARDIFNYVISMRICAKFSNRIIFCEMCQSGCSIGGKQCETYIIRLTGIGLKYFIIYI